MSNSSRPSKTRRAIAHDAGLSGLSIMSVLAGVLAAYGTFAIVAAVVGASISGSGVDTDFRTNDWTGSGAVAALASVVTLLIAYLFGGYVAGRMARRNATLHGIFVFLLSLIAGAVAGAVISLVGDNDEVESSLQNIGVPTSTDQIKGVAIAGVAASLAAILIGSILGAMLGERWHTKLARLAVDPEVGPEAEARERAEREEVDRRERVERDEAVRRQNEERAETERRQEERREAQRDGDQQDDRQRDRAQVRREDQREDERQERQRSDSDAPTQSSSRDGDPARRPESDRDQPAAGVAGPAANQTDEAPRYTADEWRRMNEDQGR